MEFGQKFGIVCLVLLFVAVMCVKYFHEMLLGLARKGRCPYCREAGPLTCYVPKPREGDPHRRIHPEDEGDPI